MATPAARAPMLVAGIAAALCAAAVASDEPELQPQRLAEGVYHVAGRTAVWGEAKQGRVANSGFVVGERCVAVIDSGGSPSAGRALQAAVRRISALPVCFVINTHAHPDHVLGNAAFADGGTTRFVGHQRLAAALAARGPHYLRALKRDFEAADHVDELVAPSVAVAGTQELDLGGRVLELRAWPTAHTDNDLTVLDRRSGTLWLGDLVFLDHLPVLDGKLVGWRSVLQTLKGWQPTVAVPGHGPVIRDWPAGMEPTERYLAKLQADVKAALRDGRSLAETVDRLGAPASGAGGWQLVDAFHRRNITAAYAELEWTE
jgi:quinoprotein relay system zinc metallohydrolase 2